MPRKMPDTLRTVVWVPWQEEKNVFPSVKPMVWLTTVVGIVCEASHLSPWSCFKVNPEWARICEMVLAGRSSSTIVFWNHSVRLRNSEASAARNDQTSTVAWLLRGCRSLSQRCLDVCLNNEIMKVEIPLPAEGQTNERLHQIDFF